jgi:ABC-2 type transport system ATP-binding protein
MQQEKYIELINVSKNYKNFKAVDELSLNVYKGDIYGFLGPNGAGKSTSIRMILSLIKPTSGKINLFGKDLLTDKYSTLSKIGALIEKPDFYKYLSARKNLEILGRLSKVKDLNMKIDEALELVGLLPRAESKFKTFSQGMKQRLGIAQALLHDPKLIILDEPANGLDPQGQREMRELIKNINSEKGITIVISSHILAEIEQIANRMIIINKGKKVIEGSVKELLELEGLRVSFELDSTEKALKSIENTKWQHKLIKKAEDKLILNLNKEETSELNRHFLDSSIQVYAVNPLKTLEDYFISKTDNA